MINHLLEQHIHPGESVVDVTDYARGSQEWAYGYGSAEVENSVHMEGNSVLLVVEPGCAVEPLKIVEPIELRVKALAGIGRVVKHSDATGEVTVEVMHPDSEAIVLGIGDSYYYLNDGDEPLVIRDDATPAFIGHEEIQLTAPPQDGVSGIDGRTLDLPTDFWRKFS